jgi:hypothetical protein
MGLYVANQLSIIGQRPDFPTARDAFVFERRFHLELAHLKRCQLALSDARLRLVSLLLRDAVEGRSISP